MILEMQATQFANFDYFSSVFFSTYKNATARESQSAADFEARHVQNIEEAERRMKPYWIVKGWQIRLMKSTFIRDHPTISNGVNYPHYLFSRRTQHGQLLLWHH